MKKRLLFLTMILASTLVQAYNKPRSLEKAMEMMESRIKKISASVNIIATYNKVAVLADEFALLALDAKTFVPDSVASLPEKDRETQKDLYLSMLDDVSGLGQKLAESLRAQDKEKVTQLLGRIEKAEKDGHSEFKKGDDVLFSAALTLPSDLKSTMKQAGSTIKAISVQAADSNLNTNSAAMADDVIALLQHSKGFTPDLIAQAPAADQAAMKTHYDKMIDDTIALAKKLADAFRANNNSLAQDILTQLNQAKKDGHAEFK